MKGETETRAFHVVDYEAEFKLRRWWHQMIAAEEERTMILVH